MCYKAESFGTSLGIRVTRVKEVPPSPASILCYMVFSKPQPKRDRPPKRGRTEVSFPPLSMTVFSTNVNDYSRFLVIESTDSARPITSLSVFLVSKFLQNTTGGKYQAKKLRTREILVELNAEPQARILLAQTRIHDLDIRVTPHRSLNSSQGVISDTDLLTETDADLLEGLEDQGVTAVRRIMMHRDDKIIPTKHIILTFNRSSLPEHINAGFIRCSIRPYIPNPRHCFDCQRFGHSTTSCRGKTTCAKCAAQDHPTDNCDSENLTCTNCRGPHAAYSRKCEKFQMEKKIINLKVTENITFPEERKRFASFPLGRYADAARRGAERRLVSTETQFSESDLVPPPPPAGLPHAAQPGTTPLAEAAAVVVQITSVGTGAAPASASPSSSALEGAEGMDIAGPAPAPTATAPPVPPLVPRTPSVVDAQTKGSRKGAKSGGPGPSGTLRTSDDDMDVWPFLPATQRKERPPTSKPTERPKKPNPRVTAPKDDT
ncbi:uncharacterized protein LOC144164247 [Haemaphysalis longicornis]